MKKLLIALFVLHIFVCSLHAQTMDEKVAAALAFAESQLQGTVEEVDTTSEYRFPRWVDRTDGKWQSSPYHKWTSGFFPGCLWYMFLYTGKPQWEEYADQWTLWLDEVQYVTSIYTDQGFSVDPTYVHGFKLTEDQTYIPVILTSAESYAGRWNDQAKVFECWDKSEWLNNPDIISGAIDQLMNLDIFFEAALLDCDETFYDIGLQYAQRVLENNVREDYGTYQVVRYDIATGEVVQKGNIQGYTDSGVWSRGQGWATYGFTMVYRYTRDKRFLDAAVGCANYFIDHMPEDGVPYWDFMAPNIPDEPKDSSASAIICSALFELIRYVKNAHQKNKLAMAALKILDTLISDDYLADPDVTNAILLHCTGNGNKPESPQTDSSQIYADYYLIEALLRYQAFRCVRDCKDYQDRIRDTRTDLSICPNIQKPVKSTLP